ncbi:MAG: transglutaminase family protein [Verrucomicrobiota bacterium]
MKLPDPIQEITTRIDETFARHEVRLTLGGEPTYVPVNPEGPEWSITALGPTKLRYAYALADALVAQALPHAAMIYSPGKTYPGEINPRWTINMVWRNDGEPLFSSSAFTPEPLAEPVIEKFKSALLRALKLRKKWLHASDPLDPERLQTWVLPLDHDGERFTSANWRLEEPIRLLMAEGPVGLRLPLSQLPPEVSRRALTLEIREERLHLFVPPLLQPAFVTLLEQIAIALRQAKCPAPLFSGYLPHDSADAWTKLGITADPGVLEINLPPCPTWRDYERWMATLETAGAAAGLRSFKQVGRDEQAGTGGGNHLLFGGPTLEQNALFTHPRWVTSILRYWQNHPALSYLFTGIYVGPSSQAPRPDESASALYDLEMAYRFLEELPPGDHRGILSETLRHLHTDGTGNTHRSEISFDKFWNVSFDGGCRGLIEFRAIESLPRAQWMAAIALLWQSLAAYLLAHPFTKPLIDHADTLHDGYYLPSHLWADFKLILRDLRKAGFNLPEAVYKEIAAWRFPTMLDYRVEGATLTIRKAHEGWPLLCETPLEGGSTSRFVDTSIERLEFLANRQFADSCRIHVQGRRLELQAFPGEKFGAGLRYRRTALYPSLHPGIPAQMPLFVTLSRGRNRTLYKLDFSARTFVPCEEAVAEPAQNPRPCRKLHPTLVTCDLRLP